MKINGVQIGDKFKTGKNIFAEVIDFLDCKSMKTGETVEYKCIAQSLGLASNKFEVPFSTVLRNKID